MSRHRAFAVTTVAAVLAVGIAAPATAAPDTTPAEPPRRPGQVILVAGIGEPGYSGDGGDARAARLGGLVDVHVAADGTVFLADMANGRLRRVTTDGVIDTVPGTRSVRSRQRDVDYGNGWIYSPSNRPQASVTTKDGTLYVAGSENIRRFGRNGKATVIAGGGELEFDPDGGDGGPATRAWIYRPEDIAVDGAGNLYVADTNNFRIRRIDRRGTITTIAGGGKVAARSAAGKPARAARLGQPHRVAADNTGTVYFSLEDDGTVYRIGKDGRLSVAAKVAGEYEVTGLAFGPDDALYVAGSDGVIQRVGADGTAAPLTGLPNPGAAFDLAVGPDGDLYLATSDNRVVRIARGGDPATSPPRPARSPWTKDQPGATHLVAGTGRDVSYDEQRRAPAGRTRGETGVAAGPDGTVYVAESTQHRVRAIGRDGRVRPFAGTGERGGEGDGKPAETAQLDYPTSVAVDADGYVYIADSGNKLVRRVDPDGIIDTVARIAARQLTIGPDGSVYVTADESVYRLADNGKPVLVAGGGDRWADEADGAPATQASLWEPDAVAVGGGNVYLVESGKPAVRAVRPNGVLVTVAGNSYLDRDEGGFAGDGGPATRAELNTPTGLAIGEDGSRYVADAFNNRIRRIDSRGVITTVAGTGERADRGDGGPATKAALTEPGSVAVGAGGELYVASAVTSLVRRIDRDGTISTLADLDPPPAEHPATETDLGTVQAAALDADGTLHVSSSPGGLRSVHRDGSVEPIPGEQVWLDIAPVRDGSLWLLSGSELVRRYPDGGEVTTVLGGPASATGDPANRPGVRNVAIGPRDEVYVGNEGKVYRVADDGSLDDVFQAGKDTGRLGAFTFAPDGSMYVIGDERVLRVRNGSAEPVTTGDADYSEDQEEDEDGGPALEADLSIPADVAVTADGTLYVATSDGVRRVNTAGVIDTVVPATRRGTAIVAPEELAVGPGGDLYLGYTDEGQVRVLVRPDEMAGPSGFAWWLLWLAGGVLVLGAAGTLLFLRHRRRAAAPAGGPPEPAPETEAEPETGPEPDSGDQRNLRGP